MTDFLTEKGLHNMNKRPAWVIAMVAEFDLLSSSITQLERLYALLLGADLAEVTIQMYGPLPVVLIFGFALLVCLLLSVGLIWVMKVHEQDDYMGRVIQAATIFLDYLQLIMSTLTALLATVLVQFLVSGGSTTSALSTRLVNALVYGFVMSLSGTVIRWLGKALSTDWLITLVQKNIDAIQKEQ